MIETLRCIKTAGIIASVALLLSLGSRSALLGQDSSGGTKEGADQSSGSAESGADGDLSKIEVDPSIWILEFKVDRVRSISILEGPHKGQVFWFMAYTIENKAEEERKAYIAITAASDRKKSYADILLPGVERAVEEKMRRSLWGKSDLFEEQKDRKSDDPFYHYTTFKAGEKRSCVAVFNKLDPGANHIQIKVRGLSNDLHLMTTEEGKRVIEDRVFLLEYNRPGDEYEINLDRFVLRKKSWVKERTELVIPPDGE